MKKEVNTSKKKTEDKKQTKKYTLEKKKVKKDKKENIFKRIVKYFKGVAKEFKRIRWTNGKDLAKYSISAIAFLLFFALYFYGVDWIALLVRSLA